MIPSAQSDEFEYGRYLTFASLVPTIMDPDYLQVQCRARLSPRTKMSNGSIRIFRKIIFHSFFAAPGQSGRGRCN